MIENETKKMTEKTKFMVFRALFSFELHMVIAWNRAEPLEVKLIKKILGSPKLPKIRVFTIFLSLCH